MAVARRAAVVRELPAVCDANLCADEIDPRDELGHGVLDLQSAFSSMKLKEPSGPTRNSNVPALR